MDRFNDRSTKKPKNTYSNYYKEYYHKKLKTNKKWVKKRRERDRREYWKDREKAKLKYQKYILKPGVKERQKETQRLWVKNNIEYVKEQSKKYWLKNHPKDYTKKFGKKKKDIIKGIKKICPRCKKQEARSFHHIIPREFKGGDNIENLIKLCYGCHNKIEMFTYDLFINNKFFSSNVLRGFIINKNFPILNN